MHESPAAENRPRFPLFVDLSGRRCLVAGAGEVGLRRARCLARFGAHVVLVDPRLSDGEDSADGRGCPLVPEGVEAIFREYEPGDEAGCALVVAATDDREANRLIGSRCRDAEIPVSVADVPGECTFFFPAICMGDDVVAGVVSRSGDHRAAASAAARVRTAIAHAEGEGSA